MSKRETRKEIEDKYNKVFSNFFDVIDLPYKIEGSFPYKYILQFRNKKERDKIREMLAAENIGLDTLVFKPLHQYFDFNEDDFPNTEKAYTTTLTLPIYPSLTEKEIRRVMSVVSRCLRTIQ